MSATEYTLAGSWNATARYTAAADTDVLLVNPLSERDQIILFTTTTSDTAPAIAPQRAAFIRYGDAPRSMKLLAGERLWIAAYGRSAGLAVLEI